jgi:hypothetical protein
MNGCARSILLQEEDAWSLWIVQVFLDNHRVLKATEHLSCGQPVLGQLIVSVFRYSNIASAYQSTHSLDELAQSSSSTSANMIFKA